MKQNGRWRLLGNAGAETLTDARLQLHWAAQLVASVGKTYLEPRPDDSHPNMGWDRATESLLGHPVTAGRGFQAALRAADLTLWVRDGKGSEVGGFSLDGSTLSEAEAWLSTMIEALAGAASQPLVPAGYDIPAHSVAEGGRFSFGEREALEELARWFANGDLVLTSLVEPFEAPVRCWPHHFDIGAWIPLGSESDPETVPSIGVGMTPGDEHYPVPYWYLSPYSLPGDPPEQLPPLPEGAHWHTEGLFSAVLTAPALTAEPTAEGQLRVVTRYLDAAWQASRVMLGV